MRAFIQFSLLVVVCPAVFFTISCASLPFFNKEAGDKKESVPSGPFFEEGFDGRDIRLAVLEPEGVNLDENEKYLLSFIQGSLTTNFNRFSRITLHDRQNLDKILAEQNLSASGYFSENDYVRMGELVNVQFFATGKLIKMSSGEFSLDLQIVDPSTGKRIHSYEKNLILSKDIRNGSAVRLACSSFLTDLGVVLTEAGRLALEGEQTLQNEAELDLAKGIEAGKSGNFVESLHFLNKGAESRDGTGEASTRLQLLSAEFTDGGVGAAIVRDVEEREVWLKRMNEFENFYYDHPPFDIVYTSRPVQRGKTNYNAQNGAAADFEFKISLRQTNDVKVMQKVLNVINKGLANSRKQDDWGFANWPLISASSTQKTSIPTKVFDRYRTFKVTMGLFNTNQDTPIAAVEVDMHGQLAYINNKIGADSSQDLKVLFSDVPVFRIDATDTLVIKVVSIDNTPVDQFEENNLLGITVVPKRLPWKQRPGIPAKHRLIPQNAPEKKEAANDTKPEKRADSAPDKPNKKEKMPLDYRIGISGVNLANPSNFDTMEFYADVAIGIKHLTFEGLIFKPWGANPFESIFNWEQPMDFGFGFGLGWALIWRNALATLEAGYIQYRFYDESSIHIPFTQFKLDIMPWKLGLGFRLGYMIEAGIPDNGWEYGLYFDKNSTFGNDNLRFKGKFMSGIVLWL
ncbi:MAG: CsgG/HfaB family protein [Treponema sp.]|jgi:hypothetical protein|nr:CsgG/HfaB family protein [Treponema sp.]